MVIGGLLKSVGKATYSSFSNVLAKTVTTSANVITAGIEKATGNEYGRLTTSQFKKSKVGKIGTAAAAVPAAGLVVAAGASGRALSVAKSLVPKTIGGKFLAATTGLTAYGTLKVSPKAQAVVEKSIETLPQKPGKIISFGESIGDVIEGKTSFTSKDVIGGLKTAGVVGGVAAAAALLVPKVGSKLNDLKGKDAVITSNATLPGVPQESEGSLVKEKPLNTDTTPAATPELQTVSTKKTRRKRRTAKKTPSVRQSVKVNIYNKNTQKGKRYLNKVYYGY